MGVPAVVAGVPDAVRRFGLAVCIGLAEDGHVHIEPGEASVIGRGTGGEQISCICNFVAVHVINGVHRVELIHSPCQRLARFGVLLVDADADFVHQIFRRFGYGQDTGVLEHDGAGQIAQFILGRVGHIDDVIAVGFIAALSVIHNGLGEHHIVALVIPAKSHRIGLVGQHKAIRGLHLGDVVGTKRQGDRHLAGGAVVGNSQEVIGGLGAGGAEFDLVYLTFFAGSHGGD